jgi:hypothetical protein
MSADLTRDGLARRQEAWQAGQDWCRVERLVPRAKAASADLSPYHRHLFFDGVAQVLSAAGRDIAGIDDLGRR